MPAIRYIIKDLSAQHPKTGARLTCSGFNALLGTRKSFVIRRRSMSWRGELMPSPRASNKNPTKLPPYPSILAVHLPVVRKQLLWNFLGGPFSVIVELAITESAVNFEIDHGCHSRYLFALARIDTPPGRGSNRNPRVASAGILFSRNSAKADADGDAGPAHGQEQVIFTRGAVSSARPSYTQSQKRIFRMGESNRFKPAYIPRALQLDIAVRIVWPRTSRAAGRKRMRGN